MNSTNCLTIIILGCYSHMAAILKAQGFHGRLEARVGDEGRPGRCFWHLSCNKIPGAPGDQ